LWITNHSGICPLAFSLYAAEDLTNLKNLTAARELKCCGRFLGGYGANRKLFIQGQSNLYWIHKYTFPDFMEREKAICFPLRP